jgi:hypothetical protein
MANVLLDHRYVARLAELLLRSPRNVREQSAQTAILLSSMFALRW